jgi:hypothetical protein
MSVVEVIVRELSWERRPENGGMVNPTLFAVKLGVFAFCGSNTFRIRSGQFFSGSPGGSTWWASMKCVPFMTVRELQPLSRMQSSRC